MKNSDLTEVESGDLRDEMVLTLSNGTRTKILQLVRLRLEGVAGQQAVEDPITDNFKLTLKIKKADN